MTATESMPRTSDTTPSGPFPADRLWVPPGAEAAVGRYRIRSGMLYVGAGLRGVGPWSDVEPALIDPSLKDRFDQPDHGGKLLPPTPSYSWIEPASRAAYLEWLARGRRDPSIGIGYVFLFFSGIERRVLADAGSSAAARAEIAPLLAEVERLLGIYGENRSFRKQAEEFLAMVRLREGTLRTEGLLPLGDPPPEPLALRVAIGRFAAAGRPIPPDQALAWALSSPEVRQRVPAQRCPAELLELFTLRYREAWPPDGLRLKLRETGLAVSYRPANPGFHVAVDISTDLPDAWFIPGHLWDLQKIIDRVSGELSGYSHWIGRTGDRMSPAALAFLPAELAGSRESGAAHGLIGWIAADHPAAEPVTVRPASPARGGFAIPRQPAPPSGVLLDPRKIQGKLAEAERVATLLEEVFAADEVGAPATATPLENRAGLDAAHVAFLRELAARPTWARTEFDRHARALGLLSEGALEVLNEAAFHRCGAPLLEGGETIDIDPEILEELLA